MCGLRSILRKYVVNEPGKGLIVFGVQIGRTKHLSDRFKNYLSWFQMPVLLYTAVLSTVGNFPFLRQYLLLIFLLMAAVFISIMISVMYLDLKLVFPNEREFMYNQTPYFERRFDAIESKLDKMVPKEDENKSNNAGC